MILFFGDPKLKLFAVEISERLSIESIKKLSWVLDSSIIEVKEIKEKFIGPKSSMITPWSTNAVEITRNMGIENIIRIAVFVSSDISQEFDRMIHEEYKSLNQNIFENNLKPEKVKFIDDLKKYNNEHGLALDDFEISYLRVWDIFFCFFSQITSTNISLLTNAFANAMLVKLFPMIQTFIINLILTINIR